MEAPLPSPLPTVGERRREYTSKLLDPRWQKLRLQVMERDGWKCRNCGDSTTTLHAHHSYYARAADPWDYPPSSIITLCESCHSKEHARGSPDDLVSVLCANGFWETRSRDALASMIGGAADDRRLTEAEAWKLIFIVLSFCESARGDSIAANKLIEIARQDVYGK